MPKVSFFHFNKYNDKYDSDNNDERIVKRVDKCKGCYSADACEKIINDIMDLYATDFCHSADIDLGFDDVVGLDSVPDEVRQSDFAKIDENLSSIALANLDITAETLAAETLAAETLIDFSLASSIFDFDMYYGESMIR